MKRTAVLILAALFLCLVSTAMAYPTYGRCIGEKVNVRVHPEDTYPSYGRLIHDAPVTVLGEEGDAYLCQTAKGKGYIPKMYIELFEDMTYEEFKEYSRDNPSEYRKERPPKNRNKYLVQQYNAGKISEDELLKNWYWKSNTVPVWDSSKKKVVIEKLEVPKKPTKIPSK